MQYSLQAIELPVNIGPTSQERDEAQIVLMDLHYSFDSKKAQKSDDLSETLDYQQVYGAAKAFVSGKEWHLLEKLQNDLKQALQEQFPKMNDVKLSITKFPFDDGAVSVGDL